VSDDGQSFDESLVETVPANFVFRQVRDHVERGDPSSMFSYVERGDSFH